MMTFGGRGRARQHAGDVEGQTAVGAALLALVDHGLRDEPVLRADLQFARVEQASGLVAHEDGEVLRSALGGSKAGLREGAAPARCAMLGQRCLL